jgi:hypothetical protein
MSRPRSKLRPIRVVEARPVPTKVPSLWSARSLAERWHVSRALLYKLHRQGRLTGVRLLGVLRFREEDVLKLMDKE